MCALNRFWSVSERQRRKRFRTRKSFSLPVDSPSLNFLSYCFLVKIVDIPCCYPLCPATDIPSFDFFDYGRAPSKRVDLCPDVVKKVMGEGRVRGKRRFKNAWTKLSLG
jgi:hypothetical protein